MIKYRISTVYPEDHERYPNKTLFYNYYIGNFIDWKIDSYKLYDKISDITKELGIYMEGCSHGCSPSLKQAKIEKLWIDADSVGIVDTIPVKFFSHEI